MSELAGADYCENDFTVNDILRSFIRFHCYVIFVICKIYFTKALGELHHLRRIYQWLVTRSLGVHVTYITTLIYHISQHDVSKGCDWKIGKVRKHTSINSIETKMNAVVDNSIFTLRGTFDLNQMSERFKLQKDCMAIIW